MNRTSARWAVPVALILAAGCGKPKEKTEADIVREFQALASEIDGSDRILVVGLTDPSQLLVDGKPAFSAGLPRPPIVCRFTDIGFTYDVTRQPNNLTKPYTAACALKCRMWVGWDRTSAFLPPEEQAKKCAYFAHAGPTPVTLKLNYHYEGQSWKLTDVQAVSGLGLATQAPLSAVAYEVVKGDRAEQKGVAEAPVQFEASVRIAEVRELSSGKGTTADWLSGLALSTGRGSNPVLAKGHPRFLVPE